MQVVRESLVLDTSIMRAPTGAPAYNGSTFLGTRSSAPKFLVTNKEFRGKHSQTLALAGDGGSTGVRADRDVPDSKYG